jgi:endonuclease-3 related protein
MVGAYFTQNTSSKNVEVALRGSGLMPVQPEAMIRPAGYFRQKTDRLKTLVAFVDQPCGGSLPRLFAQPTGQLRGELLSLNGVGPERADSILPLPAGILFLGWKATPAACLNAVGIGRANAM